MPVFLVIKTRAEITSGKISLQYTFILSLHFGLSVILVEANVGSRTFVDHLVIISDEMVCIL